MGGLVEEGRVMREMVEYGREEKAEAEQDQRYQLF